MGRGFADGRAGLRRGRVPVCREIAAYDLPLLRNFHSMALVVALLSVVLLRPPRSGRGAANLGGDPSPS